MCANPSPLVTLTARRPCCARLKSHETLAFEHSDVNYHAKMDTMSMVLHYPLGCQKLLARFQASCVRNLQFECGALEKRASHTHSDVIVHWMCQPSAALSPTPHVLGVTPWHRAPRTGRNPAVTRIWSDAQRGESLNSLRMNCPSSGIPSCRLLMHQIPIGIAKPLIVGGFINQVSTLFSLNVIGIISSCV